MVRWGIIGCGNVTEVKSGPAFNLITGSSLVAVMSRNLDKARNYALRHGVNEYYNSAEAVINNENVDAIYVATPPSSHEQYAIAAIEAGKMVYVEKPMAINSASAQNMASRTERADVKLSVAHYRRAQPIFKKVRQLLEDEVIGKVLMVNIIYHRKPPSFVDVLQPGLAWRFNPVVSGGGLFHDLAPHQLDLLLYFFGEIVSVYGLSFNQLKNFEVDDLVSAQIVMENGIVCNGTWFFNSQPGNEIDTFEILGEKGTIKFGVFQHKSITVQSPQGEIEYHFDPLPHVQQPMIKEVVNYFSGQGKNPCDANQGVKVMELIDLITGKLIRDTGNRL